MHVAIKHRAGHTVHSAGHVAVLAVTLLPCEADTSDDEAEREEEEDSVEAAVDSGNDEMEDDANDETRRDEEVIGPTMEVRTEEKDKAVAALAEDCCREDEAVGEKAEVEEDVDEEEDEEDEEDKDGEDDEDDEDEDEDDDDDGSGTIVTGRSAHSANADIALFIDPCSPLMPELYTAFQLQLYSPLASRAFSHSESMLACRKEYTLHIASSSDCVTPVPADCAR